MNGKRFIIGLCFIALGVIIGLSTFDIIDVNLFFPGWWTLFIIVPSVMGLLCDGDKSWSLVGLFIGCFLFLSCQPFFDFEIIWKLFIPFVLVVCGLNIMFKSNHKVISENSSTKEEKIETEPREEVINEKKESKKEHYYEDDILTITSIFKNTTTDLSEKKFKNNDIVKVSSIFGENKIYLSSDVNVKIKSGMLFGNIYNDKVNKDDNKITITIDCGALFGSVYIKEK